jgi:hypothetical protein
VSMASSRNLHFFCTICSHCGVEIAMSEDGAVAL